MIPPVLVYLTGFLFCCCSENSSEWSSRWSPPASPRAGGANTVRRISLANGIYILPDTQEIHREKDMVPQEFMAESQLYDPYQYMYNSDKGHLLPNSAGHDPEDWEGIDERLNRSKLDSQDTSHSAWKNPAKGKYPLYSKRYSDFDSSLQSPRFSGDDHTYINVPSPHSSEQQVPDTSFYSHPHSSGYHGSYVDDDDDENGFVPKRPPLPKEYQRMASERSVSLYDPLYENVNSSYVDDVFFPPAPPQQFPGRHSLPRHSSMKPSYQTYLTGDPVEDDGGFIQPFGADDISSVMPSFNESHSVVRDRFAYSPHNETNSRTLLEQPNWSGAEMSNYPLSSSERHARSKTRERNDKPRSHSSDYVRVNSKPSLDYTDNTSAKQRDHNSPNNRSPRNDFSFGPSQYTRDQLHGVVEKLRKGPRARRSKSAGRLPSQETNFPYSYSPQVVPNLSLSPTLGSGYDHCGDQPRQRYTHEIAPFKGERGSRSSMNSSGRGSLGRQRYPTDPRSYAMEDLTPDSNSSGRGSRNTSQATGSSHLSRIPRNSLSSYASPLEPDLSQDSSPFLDATGSLYKDTSADDNYEFDSLQALEADLLNTLRSCPLTNQSEDLRMAIESGLNTSEFYDSLYPKPSVESQYDNSEARFEKLRQEFHQFRRKQQEIFQQTRLAMDSDML